MIRFIILIIIWIFIIYYLARALKYIIRFLTIGSFNKSNPQKKSKSKFDSKKNKSYNPKDVIDADFTEIKNDHKENIEKEKKE